MQNMRAWIYSNFHFNGCVCWREGQAERDSILRRHLRINLCKVCLCFLRSARSVVEDSTILSFRINQCRSLSTSSDNNNDGTETCIAYIYWAGEHGLVNNYYWYGGSVNV